MKKTSVKVLSVVLILASLFGLCAGGLTLKDMLNCKAYWEQKGEESDASITLLEDGLNQLKENESAYNDGLAALAQGEKDYEAGQLELEAGAKALADGQKEYEAGQQTLEKGHAEYAAGEKKLADAQKELKAGWASYKENAALLSAAHGQYDAGLAQYNDGLKALEAGKAQLAAGQAQLAESKKLLDAGQAQLDAAKPQLEAYEQGRADLEQGKADLAAFKASKDTLVSYIGSYNQLIDAKNAYGALPEEQAQQLNAIIAGVNPVMVKTGLDKIIWLDGENKTVSAEQAAAIFDNYISEAEKTIAKNEAYLDAMKPSYEAGKAAEAELAAKWELYNQKLAEAELAEAKIAESEKQLAQAKATLDASAALLAEKDAELAAGYKKLMAGEAEFAKGMVTLQSSEKALEEGEQALMDAEAQLAEGQKTYDDGVKELEAGAQALEDGKAQLKAFEDGNAQVAEGLAILTVTDTVYDKTGSAMLPSIADRLGPDFNYMKDESLVDLDRGLEGVAAARQFSADNSALVTKELGARAVAAVLAIAAAILGIVTGIMGLMGRSVFILALVTAAAAAVGFVAALVTGFSLPLSAIAGSALGAGVIVAALAVQAAAAVLEGLSAKSVKAAN